MNLTPVEKEILSGINKAVQNNFKKNASAAYWTKLIKGTLAKLGKQKGYKVYTSSLNKVDGPEWLLDLIWWEEKFINLACEIEWSRDPDEILYDFQKLTVIVADFRLLIFSHYTKEKTDHIVKICKEACPTSRGFRYLLIGIPEYEPVDLFREALII